MCCALTVRVVCMRCARVQIASHSWMTKYVRRTYRAILRQLVYSVLVSNMTMSRIKACRCRAMYSAPAHTVDNPGARLTGGMWAGRRPESAATILRV